ncbi:HD-GYP domain-containing protein [Alienimonas californiensis]|uniref:Cyclic di-GMP phosphodiesterase response regulator RpfG n=1 Tax=Alienimonas californiensis TaxID=2527989 RepID=A0A517P6I1_9PLAN|nr:HD domain-containing phosphohydrolase [Alienimonas californiensis]QDT14963.1 Cyclic di-GMP phosphodiesterase response regulator RpfG [Alienimonas californiensis]
MLLLAKGAELNPTLLTRLHDRGVRDLIVDEDFLAAISKPDAVPVRDDAGPREPVPVAARRRLPPDALIHEITRPAGPFTPERERAARARRDALDAGLSNLFAGVDALVAGDAAAGAAVARGRGGRTLSRRIDGQGLRTLSVQSVADLCADFDLFTIVGLARPVPHAAAGEEDAGEQAAREKHAGAGERGEPNEAPSLRPRTFARVREHAVRTAHLALTIGAVAGLRRWELEQLAMGCLVHDAGMLRVDPTLWNGPHRLDRAAFAAVAEHPRHTLELLRGAVGVPAGARAVAVQIHERADGSGYPFRLRDGRVHRLARLAAVADAYCGMTADRPYRPALSSHDAVRVLAADAVRGRFDPAAVRAFLEAVGVFPPGTEVALSDGRCGRVIAADRNRPAGPRVELWDPFENRFTGEILDLAARTADVACVLGWSDRARVVSAGKPLSRRAPRA